MRRVIFFIVLLCLCWSGAVYAELLPYPTDTINGQAVYRYRVPRSIGLYRVSVTFGVSQEEIIKWNPQLRERGLHYDETILVPVRDQESGVGSQKSGIGSQDTIPALVESQESGVKTEDGKQPPLPADTTAVPADSVMIIIAVDSIPADTVVMPIDSIPADTISRWTKAAWTGPTWT